MKPLRIFRHTVTEGPGYLADVLEALRIPWELVAIDAGAAVPASIDDVSGLVFMGGPMSVNDDLPWIADELALIRRARAADLPMLGHCLGGQLISKALGGSVTRNPVKEIGWLPVETIAHPAAWHWLDGVPLAREVFHWHGETFSLPRGAIPLFESPSCANQGYAIGRSLGLQFHVEMTADLVREWCRAGADEIAHPSATVQSESQMCERLDARVAELNRMADALYRRWLGNAGLIPA